MAFSFRFFGLEVELWRIGDSPAAPKFNIVSKPNDWSRSVAQAARAIDEAELSETRITQRNYWTALHAVLNAAGGPVSGTKKPQPQSWMAYSIGRTGFFIGAAMLRLSHQVRAELYISGEKANAYFGLLERQKDAVEQELGYPLEWEGLPERRDCRISIYLDDAEPGDEADWPRQHEWLTQRMNEMHRVFVQRVRALDADACANTLPCSLAWGAFGEANGARSAREMRARIARYRRAGPDDRADFEIGCRILTQPFFFAEADWIPVPASWSPNVVSFKTYNTGDADGLALWEAVDERLSRQLFPSIAEEQARFGAPHLIRPRLGQGAFRVLVTDIYGRRCAVTQERTLPALEAAHIRPYGDGGAHEAQNGLLLRRDIHSLFDAGYVTVTPDLHFEVSGRIREEFDNGRHYYALHGNPLSAPAEEGWRPDPAALRWHNEHCYRG